MGIEAPRAYIEVASRANSLTATLPDGTTENLYELLLSQDSNLGFKALGIPRAQAMVQLCIFFKIEGNQSAKSNKSINW